MDPCDLPLVCLKVQGRYFMDISLPLGLRWPAPCCHDVTLFVVRAIKEEGGRAVNYINDFGGVAMDEQTAVHHFSLLCRLLKHLGLR